MTNLPPDAALRLAAIVESSEDAIVSRDLTGIVTSWNRGAERLFGYAADEAMGQSITMLIPADRAGEEEIVLARIRQGQRVEHFDTIRRRKDGTLVDVSLMISPICEATGGIVGVSQIARDVSERRRIEGELHDLQGRLMTLAKASSSILGSTDLNTVLAATINTAREVFSSDGYAFWRADTDGLWKIVRAFGVGDDFTERVIPAPVPRGEHPVPFVEPRAFEDVDAVPMIADMRDAYRREGIVSMIVFPLLIRGTRSGTLVFYSHRRRQYREIDIQVGSALANLVATTLTTAELFQEQQQAREAADYAKEQSAFLAEASTALSASLDYESTLKTVARLAVPRIADWCAVDIRDEGVGLQRLAVAHVDPDKVEFAKMLEERYPADPNAPGGVRAVIRTGKATLVGRIPYAVLDAAARDEEHRRLIRQLQLTSYMCVPLMVQGRAFGAISFVTGESGREYTEADLRFVEQLAARASLAVDNARAYARANEASRLKDEFLATLSHELRTPLNAVLGYTRMLRAGVTAPDKIQASIEVVERNATALKQIIEDVLDISRIVSGRMRLNVEPVDLAAVLFESAATMRPAADAKGVRIETMIDPLMTSVSGDPARLQQVFWNLLSNAIKFTPRDGQVQVRLSRVSSHVEIMVRDTGLGIEREFLPFVFERFRQGDASFSREQGGLGLGLAIAKQLTELHGGRIEASSDGPGEGSTFTVKLPLMAVHSAIETDAREHPRTDEHPLRLDVIPRLEGFQILAVDDDPDSLGVVRSTLEAAGATVTAFGAPSAALEFLHAHTPDVILADIGMPHMDGFQFIREVRQMDEPVRSTPAAALTAYARTQDRVASLASGFQMHLVKPIDAIELIVTVATLGTRRVAS